jgi:hypothetical protein
MKVGRPERAQDKIIARQVWYAAPKSERTIRSVAAKCKLVGHDIAVSNIARWSRDWRVNQEPPPEPPKPSDMQVMQDTLLPPREPGQLDMSDIPASLRDALDPRLVPMFRSEKLDEVQGALVKIAVAIGNRAEDIADALLDPESDIETVATDDGQSTTKTTKKGQIPAAAAGVLSGIAEAMKTIMAAKAIVSMADRNYAEGAMLRGAGQKHLAEARAIFEDGRAGRAKQIDGSLPAPDADAESDARDALRGMAKKTL